MEAVRILHLLAMAFFVGGQLMLATVVVPLARRGDREQLRAIARRFGNTSLVALVVLVITGIAMAGRFDRWGEPALHGKLGLIVIITGLVTWHMRRPHLHAIEAAVFVGSIAVVALGVTLAH